MDYLKRSKEPISIKVIGIGGGGNNAVSKMVDDKIGGVQFYLANTDAQFLERLNCPNKIVLGKNLTKGLGAGSDPKIGEEASRESFSEIEEICQGADIVFITAGMGGGTGTGGAPVLAQAAKNQGALVVATVTIPFSFEGKRRMDYAKAGIAQLEKHADALIIIENDKILTEMSHAPINQAFDEADRILEQTVRTIVDLVTIPGIINLDFADVRHVLKDQGKIHIGIGMGEGEDRAKKAAYSSINSGIINPTIEGAKNAIINITGGLNLSLSEANQVVNFIKNEAGTELNVIFGFATNESLKDKIIVTTIATGFDKDETLKESDNVSYESFNEDLRTISRKELKNDELEIDAKMKELLESDADITPEITIDIDELKNDEYELDSINDSQKDKDSESDHDLPSFLRRE